MRHSILTTHVGSLPRSGPVTDLLLAAERGALTEGAAIASARVAP